MIAPSLEPPGGRAIHRRTTVQTVPTRHPGAFARPPSAGVGARLLVAGLAAQLLAACASNDVPTSPGPYRHIQLEGTLNTRDLGGYATEDGRRVRWGRLYRSDQLSRLEDEDVEVLRELGLNVVYDFRTDFEREDEADRVPDGVQLDLLTMSYPSMDPRAITRRILRGDASDNYFHRMLTRANRGFALEHGGELAALVRSLANPDGLPALFHCTYGKDRTGFAAAMVLDILGVPWETIVEDYLLSNVYLDSKISGMSRLIWFASLFRISREDARSLLGVDRAYIESARQAILEEFGTVEAYHAAIGLDDATLERLREALLEPMPAAPADPDG